MRGKGGGRDLPVAFVFPLHTKQYIDSMVPMPNIRKEEEEEDQERELNTHDHISSLYEDENSEGEEGRMRNDL